MLSCTKELGTEVQLMCGIVGVYNLNEAPVEVGVLREMTDVQRHRGPDDQGIRLFSLKNKESTSWNFQKVYRSSPQFEGGVGFNRLSILDLSVNGHQPMSSENGSVFIAFNGEVYNAFQYRSELEACSFRFRSNTDTEIILYLYMQYGFTDMLAKLNGMFAICIVDLNTREIYLARDRMGIKPLYYYESGGVFLFASEAKSFLAHPNYIPELDNDRLDEYFAFRYCSGDGFLVRGVHQLEPGHWIRITSNRWEKNKYWEIPEYNNDTSLSSNMVVEQLEQHLQLSVQSRLLSDVKIGCQLSGGIDSSLISISASQAHGSALDAFSVVVDDPKLSEEAWINRAAGTAKIPCHKTTLEATYFLNNLQKATWHLDQPLNHPNSLGIFALAELARPFVTVLLSGEGADELFGGYNRFFDGMLRHKFYDWVPLLSRIPYLRKAFARQFAELQHTDPVGWFLSSSARQSPDFLLKMRPEARLDNVLSARRAIFNQGSGSYLSKCLKYELRTYLVDLLVRQDKMTMAHSIENRVPFLDHTLVTFVRNLPPQYLIRMARCLSSSLDQVRNRSTKVILKTLALKYFDSEFVFRQKNGFGLPLKSYFMHKRFRPIMEDLVFPGIRRRGLLEAPVIEKWWRNIGAFDNEVCESLWTCIAFELWAQQHLDRKFTC